MKKRSLLLSSTWAILLTLCSLLSCSDDKHEARLLTIVSSEQAHTHTADITYRAVKSGLRRFLLQTAEGHTHSFDLREEELGFLELGFPVVVQSTDEHLHHHSVTIQKQADL